MPRRRKKRDWQVLLKKEFAFEKRLKQRAVTSYKILLGTMFVFIIVLSSVYGYIYFSIIHLNQYGHLLEKPLQGQSYYYNENSIVGLIRAIDEYEDFLYIQPRNVNALIKVAYNEKTNVQRLEYQPALVENGKVVYATDIYTVNADLSYLQVGEVIDLSEVNKTEEIMLANKIVLIAYDELMLPAPPVK